MIDDTNIHNIHNIMKKLVATIALASTASVNAADYPGKEVELICTIDGVEGKQVTAKVEEWEHEENDGDFITTQSVRVDDTFYTDRMTMHTADPKHGYTATDYTRINRITGEYLREYFAGSTAQWISNVRNGTTIKQTTVKGICKPGKHKKQEAQF